MNKGNEVHHPVYDVASCGGPDSFSAHMIFRILGRDAARQALIFAEQKSSIYDQLFNFHLGRNTHYTPSVTADISICSMQSSDLVSNLSGMIKVNCQKERSPRRALDRNTARLSIGTAMPSDSEYRKIPGECFPIILSRLLNTLRQ